MSLLLLMLRLALAYGINLVNGKKGGYSFPEMLVILLFFGYIFSLMDAFDILYEEKGT